MMINLKPVSLGTLRKLYQKVTGISAWTPILRGRNYKRSTLDVLRKNNVKGMVKAIEAWLVEVKKEYNV